MRYSANRKTETRAAILKAAGKVFKELGFQAGSVDKVMEEAGLTAGGFYAHFPSKENLFVESLSKSLSEAESRLEQGLEEFDDSEWVRQFLKRYLSRSHRKDVLRGCAIPPLVSEVGRSSSAAKKALESHFKGWRDKVSGKLKNEDSARSRRQATALVALSLGAVSLARAVESEELADEILLDCFRFVQEALGQECEEGED
jgi:TetR/AcrR family transcriptional regulator, transcriptional repressor for nem operon